MLKQNPEPNFTEAVRVAVAELPLATRQKEIMIGLACGLSRKEICKQTGLTSRTVDDYISRLYSSLGFARNIDLIHFVYMRIPLDHMKILQEEHRRKMECSLSHPALAYGRFQAVLE